jgi:hypothetical protein
VAELAAAFLKGNQIPLAAFSLKGIVERYETDFQIRGEVPGPEFSRKKAI